MGAGQRGNAIAINAPRCRERLATMDEDVEDFALANDELVYVLGTAGNEDDGKCRCAAPLYKV